jgi:FixJ family two-component response regulator
MKDQRVYIISDQPQRQSRQCMQLLENCGIDGSLCQSLGWLMDQYEPLIPTCILAFMQMPDYLGIEIHRTISNRGIPAPVIILSEAADVPMAVTAIKQGAFDVLPWPITKLELQDAVKQALHSDSLRIKHDVARNQLQSRIDSLTPREKEILQLVVNGMSSSQIAYKLVRSEKTVKLHRAHIMKKLDCDSAHELVHRMIKLQFDLDRIGIDA